MKYIQDTDLASVIQERFLDESTANIAGDNSILDDIESKAIDYAVSYISGRYNTDLIFDNSTPLRNGTLLQIIAQIVVYRSVKRNAARKVPEDYVTLMSDSTKQLERIQSGSMSLKGLPLVPAQEGTKDLKYGNNRNEQYFI
ncbi:MAG: phage protein Gp36 family protein [Paludibacter sp.]